jgi:hypothetical protein
MAENTNLLAELGLSSLPPEQKAKVTEDLAEALQNRISLRVSEILSEKDQNHLTELIDAGKKDEASEFVLKAVPVFNAIALDEYQKLRTELLGYDADIRATIKNLHKN